VVKIERADGGNLGTQRRRRTWRPTINSGELEASNEPEVSEWVEIVIFFERLYQKLIGFANIG